MSTRPSLALLLALAVLGCPAARAQPPPDRAARLAEAQKLIDETERLEKGGKYAQAQALAEQALKVREELLGPDDEKVAQALAALGSVLLRLSKHDAAEAPLLRSLRIREKAFGPEHPDVAHSLNKLAWLYRARGDYVRAEPLVLRALRIREKTLGEDHVEVAQSLNNLALLYKYQGSYDRAEPLYQRALRIREKALGKDHAEVAQSLNNLAGLYWTQGIHDRAEPLYRRALQIREAVLPPGHPDLAEALHNLGGLYYVQGAHDRAEPLLQRAMQIREKALGPEHPDFAASLNNLAVLYWTKAAYDRAAPLLERTLAIREKALGPRHPLVAGTLNNLAWLHLMQGSLDRAAPLAERALAIRKGAERQNLPELAASLGTFAGVRFAGGAYAEAEGLYRQAVDLRERSLAKGHPDVASALANVAKALVAQDRLPEAVPLLRRAFGISEQLLRDQGLFLSESRLSGLVQSLPAEAGVLYSVLLARPDLKEARALALSAALLRKGRTLEGAAHTSRAIHQGLGPEDLTRFERLRSLRSQLAGRMLAGAGAEPLPRYQKALEQLGEEAQGLEEDLARRSAPLRARVKLPPPGAVAAQVAAALPAEGALVEIVSFRRLDFRPKGAVPREAEARYLALVLRPGGEVAVSDLGPAEAIDDAAGRLLAALGDPAAPYQQAAEALGRLVLGKVLPLCGGATSLYLSLDGQLNLVPFAALPDLSGNALLDRHRLIYLTSGRDLLRKDDGGAPSQTVVALADPAFAAPPAAAGPEGGATSRRERGLVLGRYRPLPATRREAEEIRRLLPQAQVLLGSAASEPALLALSAPGILHVATHGMFLGDAPPVAESRGVRVEGLPPPPNPLLRSALVLAGAEPLGRRPLDAAGAAAPEQGDGLATALEVAGMNLWGTQLVVLSACETGRGEVRRGQGVYGLRRAVMVAGAETLVMSLWKVNDEVTRELMRGFYLGLLAGQGRVEAMQQAAQAVRARHAHPYYWAPFIVLGRPGPLRGIRGGDAPP